MPPRTRRVPPGLGPREAGTGIQRAMARPASERIASGGTHGPALAACALLFLLVQRRLQPLDRFFDRSRNKPDPTHRSDRFAEAELLLGRLLSGPLHFDLESAPIAHHPGN